MPRDWGLACACRETFQEHLNKEKLEGALSLKKRDIKQSCCKHALTKCCCNMLIIRVVQSRPPFAFTFRISESRNVHQREMRDVIIILRLCPETEVSNFFYANDDTFWPLKESRYYYLRPVLKLPNSCQVFSSYYSWRWVWKSVVVWKLDVSPCSLGLGPSEFSE